MVHESNNKRRLDAEYGEPWNPVRGGVRVALIYPNTYYVGMSNLGFQTIYHLLNQRDDVTCERVFLPDREEREKAGKQRTLYRSLESGRSLKDFDILAFSVSFELDDLHVVEILHEGKIPPLRHQREMGREPMVWIGGVGVTINPEPLADIADVIIVGEGEELVQKLLDGYIQSPVRTEEGFEEFARALCYMDGLYFPHASTFEYNAKGLVRKIESRPGFPSHIKRSWIHDLDRTPTVSRILTPDTDLNDMFMVELDRGCGRHCRFCAAGYLYRPPRFRKVEPVLRSIREGLALTDRVGLVGTAVSDYPWMSELLLKIQSMGAKISISSLRADSLSPELIGALVQSRHKTLALAPEGGSERMREIINKGLKENEILEACRLVFSSTILNLKLYFIVGLPFEEEEDLKALVDLVLKIKSIQIKAARPQGRIGRITVSLNCFVPKPHTPFQWAPMNKKSALSKKIGYIKSRLRNKGNITVIHDLPKWAIIQGLLSRGDRKTGELLCSVVEKGGNWTQAFKEWDKDWLDGPFRPREEEEVFPWDIIDSGCKKPYLYQEYRRSAKRRLTLSCPVDLNCRRCGVCGEPEKV